MMKCYVLNLHQLLIIVNTLYTPKGYMIRIQAMNFPQLLERKFLEWQQEQGGRRTVAEFAKWIGVKQSSVSMWWNGANEPSGESIRLLAEKLGLEVYDALNLQRPDPDLHYIQSNWELIDPDERQAIRDQMEKYATKNETKRSPAKRRTSTL